MQPFYLAFQLYYTWFGASGTFWSHSSNTRHGTGFTIARDLLSHWDLYRVR